MSCPLGRREDFGTSSKHQGCSLRLPSVSVVSLLVRAGCDLRGDLESVYGSLLGHYMSFLRIKIVVVRSCQQGVSSLVKGHVVGSRYLLVSLQEALA